ncbi:Mitotic spindle assembly checkpoint protein MAD1 [Galemys pyrenaicus]|uniref:Mitotic spindle assembly checkpoint protein MAD1 n=1 Tax=Galemys pyrenaicus TaxID=202257 RepID=A0A8J5ZZL5_GALPY|nr:Mitotic spindle assembly checkpoint protein MAD1 [Galemys pyrenaicus]
MQDLEQKLCLQEQDAAIVRNMKSELVRLPKMERELKQLREENSYLRDYLWSFRETRETNGLLREELEGLQRRLGRQEKMQENLVDLELEKEVFRTSPESTPELLPRAAQRSVVCFSGPYGWASYWFPEVYVAGLIMQDSREVEMVWIAMRSHVYPPDGVV